MKKSILLSFVIFVALFSIISCNGITDVYFSNNYNVILTVPGSSNSNRSVYTEDEIKSRINVCGVEIYPIDENGLYGEPVYSAEKAAGSVIRLRVAPGNTYIVGITPYWVVDKTNIELHPEVKSEAFTVESNSSMPKQVSVSFNKDEFKDFDELLETNAYLLEGVGSSSQPVQDYNGLLSAISKVKTGNFNLPTKIYVGTDNLTLIPQTNIQCEGSINISDKNIIFASFAPGAKITFCCESGKPVFKIGKNGKLSTKGGIKVSCSENTAFEVASNGYLNFTGDILNASSEYPVILASDNAEVRIHSEDFIDYSVITVADDESLPGDSLMSSESSSIIVKNNAKLLLSNNSSLKRIAISATEKASVSMEDSEIMNLQAPAVSVGKETTLRMNNVIFSNCFASETNESDNNGNYNGIVMIDEVTEGDWNDPKVKPGYFEFSNISCNSCSGDFIVSGADIILGGENNFDSMFMTYNYDSNSMYNCFPRIFIKDDFAPNPDKPDPIKLCLQKALFTYQNYYSLVNGFYTNDYNRYNVKTGLVEHCTIYPEFFLTTDGKNISELNKDYNLTDVITLSESITNCRLNNEGIICSKFVSANGDGYNTKNTLKNIIIESTTNATQIGETSNIKYANHFWGSTKGRSKLTNQDSGVFPFFKVETAEPVIFDGSTGKITFNASGSSEEVGQSIFLSTPETPNMDLHLKDLEVDLVDCNPLIMSSNNSTVTIDNCLFNVTSSKPNPTGSDTCHIVVYGNDCTVNLTGSYNSKINVYIAGENFHLTAGPDLKMTDDVLLAFIIAEEVKDSYQSASDIYDVRYSGGGIIHFQFIK